jgi:hypothetical protein
VPRLLAEIRALPLEEARYRGFTAKRRIASFGAGYDFETNVLLPAPPLPACSVAEYRPGTQLGWHRDVPRFGIVAGVSLAAPARMRLRPYPHVKRTRALRYSITFRTMA